jgi:alcohol dehydrogenase
VVARVTAALEATGMPVTVFSGVHPNPTTGDLAAGAGAVAAAQSGRVALVAVGGGSPIDAAKGIALAAVNPQRGRALDYRSQFERAALPIAAIPTTAGTGAETNAFGVVTDPETHRKFYVGHATSLPAAAILDPDLTVGLPPSATAATGMDALTHALESYLSIRANPWSDGIALQVIRMIAVHLPRAHADGQDLEARSQMLLAAHMLRFNAQVCGERLTDVAFALGVGDPGRTSAWNADAAIDAIAGLADRLGLAQRLDDLGIADPESDQIAADALDDEVLANTPRPPAVADIHAILHAARQ